MKDWGLYMVIKVLQNKSFFQRWKFNRSLARHMELKKLKYGEILQVLKYKNINTLFQPIVGVVNSSLIGYEALNRPIKTRNFSSTEDFYQFLGDTDQIFQFEKLTRQHSIEKYVELSRKNKNTNKEFIFLNVHPKVLNAANYRSGETLFFVEKYGLDPRQIVFEITEKQAVHDYTQFERVLANYRYQGFKIAIDDVGAGYNSLKTMMCIKPDFIKLDRSFIQKIDKNNSQQELVNLFVQYASQANSKVIAEGVERFEELQVLKKLKVDYAQGYYIGRPSVSLIENDLDYKVSI